MRIILYLLFVCLMVAQCDGGNEPSAALLTHTGHFCRQAGLARSILLSRGQNGDDSSRFDCVQGSSRVLFGFDRHNQSDPIPKH
jgi:hypothetical protein